MTTTAAVGFPWLSHRTVAEVERDGWRANPETHTRSLASLTPKQAMILRVIARTIRRHGYAPTFRDIAAETGANYGTVLYYINQLEAARILTRRQNGHGTIDLALPLTEVEVSLAGILSGAIAA